MNWIDIILILCFIPAIISGIRKGFISQVASIIIIVAGVWLSYEFSGQLSEWMSGWLHANENVIRVISFVVIFLIVAIILTLLTRVLEGLLKIILLGWLNKLLGFIFAILKYALILCLLVYVFDIINKGGAIIPENVLDDSVLYGALSHLNEIIFPYLQGFLISF